MAQLALTASLLSGCASQNVVEERLLVSSNAAPLSRSSSTPAAKPIAQRQAAPAAKATGKSEPAPAHEVREPSRVSPEPASNTADRVIPANAKPVAGPTVDTTQSVLTPNPRALRALGCREQMVREHPTSLFGEKGSAAAERDHFERCMNRAGDGQ